MPAAGTSRVRTGEIHHANSHHRRERSRSPILIAGVHEQQPSQGTVSIPDFSGIWAHLTFPDVEPPLSGAGPVRNLSRVTIEVALTLAPYNGAATAGASPNGVSNVSELVGDFTNPILKPEAAEVVKQHGELSKKKIPYPTPSNQC